MTQSQVRRLYTRQRAHECSQLMEDLTMKFYNSPESRRWLEETHLKSSKERPEFYSFLLWGNEDCPYQIRLFKHYNPAVDDSAVATYVLIDGEGYVRVER